MKPRLACWAIGIVSLATSGCPSSSPTTGCGAGLTSCAGSCVDLQTNSRNCGGCGSTCPQGSFCAGGTCGGCIPSGAEACTNGADDDCDGATDCGDSDCASDPACVGCSCSSGWTCCASRCVDPSSDPANCGGCGFGCPTGTFCSGSTCWGGCPGGTSEAGLCGNGVDDDCDGSVDCFDADCAADPACASCTVCGTGCCAAGLACCPGTAGRAPYCYPPACLSCCMAVVCEPVAASETGRCTNGADDDCDGAIDCDDSDCAADPTCLVSSMCACPSGAWGCACSIGANCCGGACRDFSSDPQNCGACGTTCPSGTVCSGGACQAPCMPTASSESGRCANGFDDDCDGAIDCFDPNCDTDPTCPMDCSATATCPPGYACACGGPGPSTHCECGLVCTTEADCTSPYQPVCCSGTCTDACTCFCG